MWNKKQEINEWFLIGFMVLLVFVLIAIFLAIFLAVLTIVFYLLGLLFIMITYNFSYMSTIQVICLGWQLVLCFCVFGIMYRAGKNIQILIKYW